MPISKLTDREREMIEGSNPGLALAEFAARFDEIIDAVNAAGTIETSEIAAGAVTAAKLATNSVETAKIAAGAVTAAKLATGLGVKVARVAAANAGPIAGLTDVGTVLGALAFLTADGTPDTPCLLTATTDYTVADGVVTTVGDRSAETWLIFYLAA